MNFELNFGPGGLSAVTVPAVIEIAWDGGGDGISWMDASNWENDILPSPNHDVVIDIAANVTVTLLVGANVTINNLRFSGGSLIIDGELTVNAQIIWTVGTIGGGGRIITNGEMNISGAGSKILSILPIEGLL